MVAAQWRSEDEGRMGQERLQKTHRCFPSEKTLTASWGEDSVAQQPHRHAARNRRMTGQRGAGSGRLRGVPPASLRRCCGRRPSLSAALWQRGCAVQRLPVLADCAGHHSDRACAACSNTHAACLPVLGLLSAVSPADCCCHRLTSQHVSRPRRAACNLRLTQRSAAR